ncbi:F0F1 ATP synthase subunit A [Anaeromyxobacter sp. Fw109-5]|uniref:ATP synthase subunit a n=1 Tax=Anaeromyxobacter sp. (strain Fw109-5) TaxID=404589 RepID=ATP6_ANADF|nr:F0F1 ATP synthase subunit A [Anaeromyxobacter sp. Fw109-5]A7HIW9.1 RecName: Full=ATP synthase subunit a; AltName: Full=ATP synthase F0 sector subunit a; AltName: Full=F-ATPase subunit 6 [Anaeromyxobacter sp. Fw109-5]ABS28665.1 ATP synthase F0, A subunit [Anaeromyxobacter sp. Fw109-5]
MTAASLVTLALSLSLAQAAGHAGEHGAPAPEVATPAEGHGARDAAGAATDPHGAAAEHGAAAHEDPAQHGAAGAEAGHDESLGAVMMHHVADGYVLELPGFCGGLSWACHVDLRDVFGTEHVSEIDAHGHAVERNVSGPLVFGKVDMTPTKHVVMMWIASAILLLVVFAAVRKKSLVPRGLYNFIEMLVQFVRNEIAVKNIGEKDADRFVPYLVSAFFFILFLNLFGLVPFAATATANISVTVMMAVFTFLITQYAQIRAVGVGGYFAHMTGGVPKSLWPLWFIMIPVEFLGLFTKPFALTVRLFANMVAGHFVILALLGLIFALNSQWIAIASVPMALSIYMLELFVAFVQAYIFTMLSSLFIGSVVAHHGHEDEHEEHGHGAAATGGAHGSHGSHVAGASPGHG